MLTILRNFHYCLYRLTCDEESRSAKAVGRLTISAVFVLLPTIAYLSKAYPLRLLPNELYILAPILLCLILISLIDHRKWAKKGDAVIKGKGYWTTYLMVFVTGIALMFLQWFGWKSLKTTSIALTVGSTRTPPALPSALSQLPA